MGNCLFKKKVPVVTQTSKEEFSRYSMKFKYYITPLRTRILTDKIIDAAIHKCHTDNVWVNFFKCMFQYIEPNGPPTDVMIRLSKISKNEYNGEIHWTFPKHPEHILNHEIKINCPTGIHTITGKVGWAGISFLDIIKEIPYVAEKIEG